VLATLPDTVRLPVGVLAAPGELDGPGLFDETLRVVGAGWTADGNVTSCVVAEDPVADFSTTTRPIPVSSAPSPLARRHRVRLYVFIAD
jgi:hypothetical protein